MKSLPFASEQFFEVFVRYNDAVWPMQLVLNGAALICIGLLFVERAWASHMISLLLAGLWLWMALAYHLAFFSAINPAAWWFGILFALGAMAFDWFGVVHDRLRFYASGGAWQVIGALLLIFALGIYPAVSYVMGHSYPAAPTFGLPCPTTVFTIGMLLFAEAPAPRAVFAVPIIWSMIGALAALWFGMLEDLSLLVSGGIGLAAVLFLDRPTKLTLHSDAPHAVRP
jgi:hypothetical protein